MAAGDLAASGAVTGSRSGFLSRSPHPPPTKLSVNGLIFRGVYTPGIKCPFYSLKKLLGTSNFHKIHAHKTNIGNRAFLFSFSLLEEVRK